MWVNSLGCRSWGRCSKKPSIIISHLIKGKGPNELVEPLNSGFEGKSASVASSSLRIIHCLGKLRANKLAGDFRGFPVSFDSGGFSLGILLSN